MVHFLDQGTFQTKIPFFKIKAPTFYIYGVLSLDQTLTFPRAFLSGCFLRTDSPFTKNQEKHNLKTYRDVFIFRRAHFLIKDHYPPQTHPITNSITPL